MLGIPNNFADADATGLVQQEHGSCCKSEGTLLACKRGCALVVVKRHVATEYGNGG